MSDDKELRSCPFCGSGWVGLYKPHYHLFAVLCNKCSAEGPAADSEDEAADAWNRRAAANQGEDGKE